MFIKKDGPPLLMEIYVGGRCVHQTPGPSSKFREYALFALFKKSLANGDFNQLEPGRYAIHLVRDGRWWSVEARPMSEETA